MGRGLKETALYGLFTVNVILNVVWPVTLALSLLAAGYIWWRYRRWFLTYAVFLGIAVLFVLVFDLLPGSGPVS
ncbi:protein of unknown function [Candidatus Hydrogenisulfobacillus filiaventi]|uniref:Uncharacterized protein n=1 Tax=Candidatus Hydrogenisulfobacillus filiaventi TaxID=2707344 RepID=A0A6F8ZFH3_9FIRM|nr:hypothetical protein [Bacillota bacterium]CAB1128212.1 protein of unknown function [Candidatus Hydrogenisulfobacillus filiaventi]